MSRRKEKIWHSIYRSTWSSFRKKNPYITILGISASLFFPFFFFFLLAFPKRSGVHRPTGRTTVKDRIKRILTCWSLNNGFNLANGFPCVLAQFYLTITSFNHHTNLEKNSIIKSLSSSLYSHHHPRVARGKKKKFKSMKTELLILLFLIVSLKVLSSSACTADNSSCKPEKQLKRKQAFMVVFICLNHSFDHKWLGL